MSGDAYSRQHRGDRGAYDRYLAGMDASMRQKVALTAAHLLAEGRVADMGMGSGTGSHALAALYPALDVVGVDISETMVAMARERHDLPNLSFEVGDIATRVFDDGALDGIFNSSVLHHVTSFGGYAREAAARALAVQVRQLATGGVLIVRDFLDPGPGDVLLDLPDGDGDDSDDPQSCSTAALFERFATEFRSLATERGFHYKTLAPQRAGWRRYRVAHTHAVEFLLRKDYRRDWQSEVQEEYTYATQDEFEAQFAGLGLRVLASTPIRNPWILRNRFEGKFELRDTEGQELEMPATNYIIVGERAPADEGVRFEQGDDVAPLGFLSLEHYRDRTEGGRVLDLVYRGNATVDVLPWFETDGDVFVLARRSYPRPVLQAARRGSRPLDGARAVGYVTEPLCAIQGERPLGQTVETLLADSAGIGSAQIRALHPGAPTIRRRAAYKKKYGPCSRKSIRCSSSGASTIDRGSARPARSGLSKFVSF